MVYKVITKNRLSDFFLHNIENGQLDKAISCPRAIAFIKNPHVEEDEPCLIAIYDENDNLVGYIGLLGEYLQNPLIGKKVYWGSTQWLEPKYRGKGYSVEMMKKVWEVVDNQYFAIESSPSSYGLNKKMGSKVSFYSRYYLVLRTSASSVKGNVKNYLVQRNNTKALCNISKIEYSNRYIKYIDDETYSFIVKHSENDLFLRKQDHLNWQIANPFFIPIYCDKKNEKESVEFRGCVKRFETVCVQVLLRGELVGFYVLNIRDAVCSVLYLYYEEKYAENVFASIATFALSDSKIEKFRTFSKALYDKMLFFGIKSIFSKSHEDKVSLSVPVDFWVDPSLYIQGGDGDMV